MHTQEFPFFQHKINKIDSMQRWNDDFLQLLHLPGGFDSVQVAMMLLNAQEIIVFLFSFGKIYIFYYHVDSH